MARELPANDTDLNRADARNVLFLSLGPSLHGPIPKLTPLVIDSLERCGFHVTRIAWGRHSENENLSQKTIGRLQDIGRVLVELAKRLPAILYVATTLDERALVRDLPLLFLVRWSPAKKVIMMHGSKTAPLLERGNRWYKFFTRRLIALSDAILLLSTEEVEKWTKFCPDGRYYLVDNPFTTTDANEFDAAAAALRKTSPSTLLFVGRLTKEKGIFDLLDAMPLILRQRACQLVIAGEGEERANIFHRIESANLSQSVSCVGYLSSSQLSEVYKRASVFVLPSFREGFPSSITEAMSYGLPIVATKVGGIPDHLQEGVNVAFVPVGDPRAIADAVLLLLSDPGLCEEMGRANMAKVRVFSPENIAPKYLAIFHELLGSQSR